MIDSSLFFLGGLWVLVVVVLGVEGGSGVDRLYVTLSAIFHPSLSLPTKKNFKGKSHITHVESQFLNVKGECDMFDTDSKAPPFKRRSSLFKNFRPFPYLGYYDKF